VLFVIGSLLVQAPPIDAELAPVLRRVGEARRRVLAGTLFSTFGGALILWPITAVASADDHDVWRSLALFSMAVAVAGSVFLTLAAVATAALVWRGPEDVPASTARLLLDAAHLATWCRRRLLCPSQQRPLSRSRRISSARSLCSRPVAKVATVVVEILGVGVRSGWNAGGWAAGTSGYATTAWFALLLFDLL
jgi:hypothetical protein